MAGRLANLVKTSSAASVLEGRVFFELGITPHQPASDAINCGPLACNLSRRFAVDPDVFLDDSRPGSRKILGRNFNTLQQIHQATTGMKATTMAALEMVPRDEVEATIHDPGTETLIHVTAGSAKRRKHEAYKEFVQKKQRIVYEFVEEAADAWK